MSEPLYPAVGAHQGAVVFFSSASQNTARFVANCHLEDEGFNVYRIPLRPKEPALHVREPYVLIVPTYGGGNPKKALTPQVRRFLNEPENRSYIRAVIASGNTNFGDAFCAAGDIISAKCHVPFVYYFELMGTPDDQRMVRKGLVDFFANQRAKKTADSDPATTTDALPLQYVSVGAAAAPRD